MKSTLPEDMRERILNISINDDYPDEDGNKIVYEHSLGDMLKPEDVDKIMSLLEEADRKAREEYSWDSWPIGWSEDENHRRSLVLIKNGKIVAHEVVVDGMFCKCEPYRHGWPTVEACIETWAKARIAEPQSPSEESKGRKEDR